MALTRGCLACINKMVTTMDHESRELKARVASLEARVAEIESRRDEPEEICINIGKDSFADVLNKMNARPKGRWGLA